MLEYHAAYYVIEDGWYMAKVLDFPGVASQGKTLKSARRMILDALREMVQWYLEEGQPLPKPKPRIDRVRIKKFATSFAPKSPFAAQRKHPRRNKPAHKRRRYRNR